MTKKRQMLAVLLGCAAPIGLTAPAFAQAADAPAPDEAVTTDDSAAVDDTAPGGDIVVTGSRLSNGNNAPTPVTVLEASTLQTVSSATVADALDKLPSFGSSANQRTTGNGETNAVGNFLNLRGLGTQRGLILFDGHRVPFTSLTGGVDVNTIPQFLLERVEVVTGGASAVYGSDAVAGVVNFIVDRDFNGIKAEAEAGISGRNDNQTQRFGIAGGTSILGGRVHVLASYNYFNSEGIDANTERRNGALIPGLTGAGTQANPYRLSYDLRTNIGSVNGRIRNGPQIGQQINAAGNLVPFVNGAATASATIESGGDGFYYKTPLLAGLESHQFYGRVDADLSDSIRTYAQLSVTRTKNDYPWVQHLFTSLQLRTDNPYLTPATQAALSSTGATTFNYNRILSDNGGQRLLAKTNNYFANVGIEGEFGGDWKWELSYTNAETKQKNDTLQNPNVAKLAAASDAVRAPNGQIVCQVTLTNPTLFPGCVPINPFGAGNITPEALDYVTDRTGYTLTQGMDDLSASITGTLLEGWAGPIRVALSGDYRRTTLENVSTALPLPSNCTGLRVACSAALQYRANSSANQSGKQKVGEVAGEIEVPLLADKSFADSLSVTGAVRYTHYDTSGSVTTWKVGGDWRVNDAIRFRVTRSRDIRAPNVFDLFAAANQNPAGYNDPHTGTSGVVQSISSGNQNLTPEIGDTFTAGVVLKPGFLPGFTASLDYYTIKIKDAITTIGGFQAAPLCEASNGTSPLCALIIRPLPFSDRTPANYPTQILSQPQNVASLEQSGIDGELGYRTTVGDGALSLRLLATYVAHQKTQQFDGAPNVEYVGTTAGLPKLKLALFTQFTQGDWSLDVLTRWRSKLVYNKDPRLFYATDSIPTAMFTDATLTYKLNIGDADAAAYISVQNLFDKNPPLVAPPTIGVPGFGFPAYIGDDVIGRRFNVGVRVKF